MSPGSSSIVLAWLLTYAIHSTVLFGLVWLTTRLRRVPPVASEILWKAALVGGIATATVQTRLHLQPKGTVSLAAPAAMTIIPGTDSKTAAEPLIHSPVPPVATPPQSSVARRIGNLGRGTALPVSAATVVVMVWGAVALFLALGYASRRLILVGRLGDRRPVDDTELLATLAALRRESRHRRWVRLTCATTISSPFALGADEICVPSLAISDLDRDQQRSMLAHELAHLARRDPLWLDVASVIERVFFFQPLNRLARRELETAAEYLCDEWAMRRTGTGLHLAQCLAKVAEWIQASPLGVPVAGMAEQRSLLVARITRLLEGKNMNSTTSRRGAAALAVVLLVAMVLITPGVSGTARRALQQRAGAGEHAGSGTVQHVEGVDRAASDASGGSVGAGSHSRAGRDQQPTDTAVVMALVARLKDDDAQVRRAAARSLGRLQDDHAVPGLIDALKDPEADVRADAADALSNFDDPRSIAPLTALLADSSPDVKHNALDALSHFEHGVPAGAVVRVLNDSSAEVRQEAVQLLHRIGDRSATAAIARMVHDPVADVRSAAVDALGELGDASVAAPITDALGDTDPDVRQQALEALEHLKIAIPDATLLKLLHDANANVRQRAAELAGSRSIVAMIPALRQLIDDPKADVRESAVEALGNMADPGARDALRVALGSKDAKVRRAAAEALGDNR